MEFTTSLGCILKQPDSTEKPFLVQQLQPGVGTFCRHTGLSPSSASIYHQFNIQLRRPVAQCRDSLKRNTSHAATQRYSVVRLCAGLFPFQSRLLRESLLVSFPPHSNMLKFCGYSSLRRGRLSKSLWLSHATTPVSTRYRGVKRKNFYN